MKQVAVNVDSCSISSDSMPEEEVLWVDVVSKNRTLPQLQIKPNASPTCQIERYAREHQLSQKQILKLSSSVASALQKRNAEKAIQTSRFKRWVKKFSRHRRAESGPKLGIVDELEVRRMASLKRLSASDASNSHKRTRPEGGNLAVSSEWKDAPVGESDESTNFGAERSCDLRSQSSVLKSDNENLSRILRQLKEVQVSISRLEARTEFQQPHKSEKRKEAKIQTDTVHFLEEIARCEKIQAELDGKVDMPIAQSLSEESGDDAIRTSELKRQGGESPLLVEKKSTGNERNQKRERWASRPSLEECQAQIVFHEADAVTSYERLFYDAELRERKQKSRRKEQQVRERKETAARTHRWVSPMSRKYIKMIERLQGKSKVQARDAFTSLHKDWKRRQRVILHKKQIQDEQRLQAELQSIGSPVITEYAKTLRKSEPHIRDPLGFRKQRARQNSLLEHERRLKEQCPFSPVINRQSAHLAQRQHARLCEAIQAFKSQTQQRSDNKRQR